MPLSAESVLALARELCAFRTGVVALENEALFERIAAEVPLTVRRYASGSSRNGWLVPDLWRVHRAMLSRDGREVFDFGRNALGVAEYSRSFRGTLSLEELRERLVTNPELPHAHVYHCMWQYRPWEADWALSLPHELAQRLEPGEYELDLVTSYEPGEMLVGDLEIPGRSERTLVFNAHTCHPHMANDGMAAVAVLVRLAQWLLERDNQYSYRFVFAPEHLGTVFWLAERDEEELDRMVAGAFCEMPGVTEPLTVASTFLGGQPLDLAFRNAARHSGAEHRLVGWRRGPGNDETVWEAPGYEVPFVQVARCREAPPWFPEYHSDLDAPALVDLDALGEFVDVFRTAVEIAEGDAIPHRRFDGIVCLSNPQYDLYFERPDPAVEKNLAPDSEKWGYLLDCLLRYLDGDTTVLEIAERHDLPFGPLLAYLRRFEAKGLVELEHAPIERLPVRRLSARGSATR